MIFLLVLDGPKKPSGLEMIGEARGGRVGVLQISHLDGPLLGEQVVELPRVHTFTIFVVPAAFYLFERDRPSAQYEPEAAVRRADGESAAGGER